jgi:monovalent cation:H+ antiporter, CPA1 family
MASHVELFPLDAMDSALVQSVTLLLVAILVAVAARRVELPYTVGLVIAGIVMAASHLGSGQMLTHDFIFDVILPPLLFEAAISLHWHELKADAVPVTVLSIFGVIIAAVVVGFGMIWLLHWPTAPAALFGVLIAATDPVAVIALFKDTGVKGRLRLLVESESLFNDGVAAVLFGLVLSWVESAPGQGPGVVGIVKDLLITAGGGTLIGAVTGGVTIMIAGRTRDHLVETAVTTVAAYGSFLVAQHFGTSGVLAVVTAGLIMGNIGVMAEQGRNRLSAQGRAFVVAFWEFAAFIANSLVFLLIGLKIGAMPILNQGLMALVIAIGLVQVGRVLTVYPLCALFARSATMISMRQQHILVWGGLRGALGLALALALPAGLPLHNEIVVATFSVVAFSVVVQGVTMPALMRALDFLPRRRGASPPK